MGKALLEKLGKSEELELTVKGRKSGKPLPRPVWFTVSADAKSLYLVPVEGRKTQWCLKVRKDSRVTIRVGGESFSGQATEVKPELFEGVLKTFVRKYGKGDMDRYYPRKDIDPVAFEVRLPQPLDSRTESPSKDN